MLIVCAHCGQDANKRTGEVNRAKAAGLNLYCSRFCSGMARRKAKSAEQRKEEKRLYDIEYREKNAADLKVSKAEYYQRAHDPVKEAIERKKRMPAHVEYCRRPEYRQKKKAYDRRHRAENHYGEFSECAILVMEIRDECLSLMSDYDIRLEKGTLNKSQQRKREDARSVSTEFEASALGNLDLGQRR